MTPDQNEAFARSHMTNIKGRVEIVYEPRNDPEPWMVTLGGDWGEQLPPHVHARSLHHGLKELDKLLDGVRNPKPLIDPDCDACDFRIDTARTTRVGGCGQHD